MSVHSDRLALQDLRLEIRGNKVLDGVDLHIDPGEVVAVVGESGCGKSLTAMSIVRLLPAIARVTSGSITLGTRDILAMSPRELRHLRGNRISVIFQEPAASLDPLRSVGEQVTESLRIHRGLSARVAGQQAIRMLEEVGISDAPYRARQYPHELSGGMCQRVMIAAALICQPQLLIADEPTTALDPTIQAQILDLMRALRERTGASILLITHDMGVVADMADRVAVMYGGRVVETGPVDAIFSAPAHPYTRLLLATLPRLDGARRTPLKTIAGTVPDAANWLPGCRFRDRCPLADAACTQTPVLSDAPTVAGASAHSLAAPDSSTWPDAHRAACWHMDRSLP